MLCFNFFCTFAAQNQKRILIIKNDREDVKSLPDYRKESSGW
jgi:hypothetical protein